MQQCLRWGLRLTTPEEARTIREYAEEHTADIGEPDLAVLGYWEWLDGLEHGTLLQNLHQAGPDTGHDHQAGDQQLDHGAPG